MQFSDGAFNIFLWYADQKLWTNNVNELGLLHMVEEYE